MDAIGSPTTVMNWKCNYYSSIVEASCLFDLWHFILEYDTMLPHCLLRNSSSIDLHFQNRWPGLTSSFALSPKSTLPSPMATL